LIEALKKLQGQSERAVRLRKKGNSQQQLGGSSRKQ